MSEQLKGAALAWEVIRQIEQQPERLNMSHWHNDASECGTTHCFAGWVQCLLRSIPVEQNLDWYFRPVSRGGVPSPYVDPVVQDALGLNWSEFEALTCWVSKRPNDTVCGLDELRERVEQLYGPRPDAGTEGGAA